MAADLSVEELTEFESLTDDSVDHRAVAEQLQRVYEHVLNGKRPEAVGATEQLAEDLDIDIRRPDRFPNRARR